jgi:hypothetical protein
MISVIVYRTLQIKADQNVYFTQRVIYDFYLIVNQSNQASPYCSMLADIFKWGQDDYTHVGMRYMTSDNNYL